MTRKTALMGAAAVCCGGPPLAAALGLSAASGLLAGVELAGLAGLVVLLLVTRRRNCDCPEVVGEE